MADQLNALHVLPKCRYKLKSPLDPLPMTQRYCTRLSFGPPSQSPLQSWVRLLTCPWEAVSLSVLVFFFILPKSLSGTWPGTAGLCGGIYLCTLQSRRKRWRRPGRGRKHTVVIDSRGLPRRSLQRTMLIHSRGDRTNKAQSSATYCWGRLSLVLC